MGLPQLYPMVRSVFRPTALGRGPFEGGSARGVTVHHAADRDLNRVQTEGATTRIGYHLVIDRDGFVHQTTYMDQMVAHAGEAIWNGLSPNRAHVAVSLLSWGRLTKTDGSSDLVAWDGATVHPEEAAMRQGNLSPELAWWDAATPAQEEALFNLLRWFVACGIDPANICGHDECALPVGRKDDPGGVLSMTMQAVRLMLSGKA